MIRYSLVPGSPFTRRDGWRAIALLATLLVAVRLPAADHIAQHGITWTFDADYPSGQFVNGDYWVVGPVNIVAISPRDRDLNDAVDLHGSVINPQPVVARPYNQSWDSRIGSRTTYVRANNIARALPRIVDVNSSIVSVRSDASGPGKDKLHLDDAAVLTVLESPPPPGSFRPPYAGSDKITPGRADDLDLSFLRSLAPVAGAPNLATFTHAFEQPMIDIIGQWPNSSLKNANAGPHYGRDIARQVADAALVLNLNYPDADKRALLVKLVQRGIDTYGLAKAGMVWTPNGGHNIGRKLPLLLAAKALRHPEMLAWCDGAKHPIFQEDTQHFIITADDIATPRGTPDSQPYTQAMIDLPEWASNPITERDKTGAEWQKPYRITNGNVGVGLVLAAELMALRSAWNHEPFFNYITERYWPTEGPSASTKVAIPAFHRAMWLAYHATTTAHTPPPSRLADAK